MKYLFLVFMVLPLMNWAQTTDFSQITGEYYKRDGGKVTITYADKEWDGEPTNKVTFETNGFFHRMMFSETESNRVGGRPVFIMEGIYILVELEPGVWAKISLTPSWSLDGNDRVAAVYAKKKDLLSKWTDQVINAQLVKFAQK